MHYFAVRWRIPVLYISGKGTKLSPILSRVLISSKCGAWVLMAAGGLHAKLAENLEDFTEPQSDKCTLSRCTKILSKKFMIKKNCSGWKELRSQALQNETRTKTGCGNATLSIHCWSWDCICLYSVCLYWTCMRLESMLHQAEHCLSTHRGLALAQGIIMMQ